MRRSNKYYMFWVCVCSLSYTAMKCAWAVLYSHLWPVWLYHIFPQYLLNGTIFEKKIYICAQIVCFDFLYKFCLKFSEKIEEKWSETYFGLHINYVLFLWVFNDTWIFFDVYLENPQIWSVVKIFSVESSCFIRANGQTQTDTDRHGQT